MDIDESKLVKGMAYAYRALITNLTLLFLVQ